MKSSAFIKIVAEAYRVEEKTVTLYARFMKEAGLITSGARGVNAPHMHPRDAVRLTIALLATGTAAHAVQLYQRFASMTYQPDRYNGPHPASLGVHEGATLESVLLHMFTADMFPEGVEGGGPFECSPYLELQENQRIATIEHSPLIDGKYQHGERKRAGLYFATRNRPEDMALEDRCAHGGIMVSRGIAPSALSQCALPFYLEWRDKVSWETMQKETEEESIRRHRDGDFTPDKGLWFERDLGEA
ncbi:MULTISPECIES: hypothetical protein [Alphaproteobacteria]|jgi:hypothetical protein|uniref:Uncharacterized protein n=1 Tax=Marinovum algicola TaxID=42444 RepID=A0A975ZR95_9RHOB|nr:MULTISPECIES: hypothetical protein [Marinovum]MDD9739228.1 hypothetical protein [Marinovum sp. SP66]SEK12281.1 hypothetical protein SAMN04487940_1505 [Marinovum algicola]SLN77792.1 hypothetical protein MAA5396_05108 [Marinovum algicola]